MLTIKDVRDYCFWCYQNKKHNENNKKFTMSTVLDHLKNEKLNEKMIK
jgi:hypothetical protein